MSGTPENSEENVKPEPRDDTATTADTDEGALTTGSSATGDPSSRKYVPEHPPVEREEPRPGKLVEGNRVVVAEDME